MCIVTFWRHPDRSNFLHFHEVFWKFWPNNRLMSRFWGWRPPLGNPGSASGSVSSRRSRCARDALPSQSNLFISMQFSAKIVPNNSLAPPSWIGTPFWEILDPPLVSIWEILDPDPHSRSTLFLHFHRLLGKTGQMIFWHHPSAWAPIPSLPLRNPGSSIGDTSSLPNHPSVTQCKRKENFVLKQECIPVGCVPSAAMTASGGGGGGRGYVSAGGVRLPGGCLLGVSAWGCLPRGKWGLPGGSDWGGVCLAGSVHAPRTQRQTPLLRSRGRNPPSPPPPPPVDRILDTRLRKHYFSATRSTVADGKNSFRICKFIG